jgi:SAM-dependent methyltransferase
VPPYNFGIYHWRRRLRAIAGGLVGLVVGVALWRRGRGWSRLLGALLVLAATLRLKDPLQRLLDPPPWSLEGAKYERLAAGLDLEADDRLLDVGTGTGRSLVGQRPAVPASVTTTALDVFDARVILGNGPRLAKRNASRAGLDVRVVRGDATTLPLGTNTQDAVTVSRVLHDLPDESSADAALAEIRRVLASDGRLGVLEVPVTHDEEPDPLSYWRTRLEAAGFEVDTAEWVDGYLLFHANPP